MAGKFLASVGRVFPQSPVEVASVEASRARLALAEAEAAAQEQAADAARRYNELCERFSAQTAQIAELTTQVRERDAELERCAQLREFARARWASRYARSLEEEATTGYWLLAVANAYAESVERARVNPCRLPDVPPPGWRLRLEAVLARVRSTRHEIALSDDGQPVDVDRSVMDLDSVETDLCAVLGEVR